MSTNTKIKSPYRQFPTHRVNTKTWFFQEQSYLLDESNFVSDTDIYLQGDEEVLVLDNIIGDVVLYDDNEVFKTNLCKIQLLSGQIGYVQYSVLTPLEDIPNFFPVPSTRIEHLPNRNSAQINWKTQPINEPYEDTYLGAWCVHYEFSDIVAVDGSELVKLMSLAREKSLKLIFEKVGFELNDEISKKLLNDYYQFITAEEWYLDPRPCSTLRVFVVLPKIFLYADNPNIKKSKPKTESAAADSSGPNPEIYFIKKFNNYEEYKNFFDKLIQRLESFNIAFKPIKWVIEPETNVDFGFQANNIKGFVEQTDLFIFNNHPNTVKKELPDIFSTEKLIWTKSLELVIDKKERRLKIIKYYDEEKRYSLTVGLFSYLKNDFVINSTTINYIIQFDPEKDSIDPLKSATQNMMDAAPVNMIAPALIPATFLIGLAGGNPEEDIKKFLTEKHYPIITNVYPKPVDLAQCTVDTVERIKDLQSVRAPQEIAKWKKLRKAYDKKKVQNEGDLFRSSLTVKDFVRDPNMRILFGIDKLPGKTNKQKLASFIRVARALDWAKFLGVSAQCLSAALPPEVVMTLMAKYKEARKFIEKIFLSTVCNPYLKNGLKVINGFELPVLTVYNPNKALIKELENAVIQITNDLISLGIKKALEAAAKACTTDPLGQQTPAIGSNPFDSSNIISDSELENFLKDTYGFLKLDRGPLPEDAQNVRNILNDIIRDITACLSFAELCSLYKGESTNDEVYQIIISLIKRKYGSPYSEMFGTRDQIIKFFRDIGNRLDLDICQDILSPESPISGPNILCDDGRVRQLRKEILENKGLTPEMIDDLLDAVRKDEEKALEDVLKLLDSDNPFDFSKVPDLACRIFPNGESVAPSPQTYLELTNTIFKQTYNSFDKEAKEWYKTSYSEIDPNSLDFLTFDSSTGLIVTKPVSVPSAFTDFIKSNSGKTNPDEQEAGSSAAKQKTKYPAYMLRHVLENNKSFVSSERNPINGQSYITFSGSLDGNIQQQVDIKFIEKELRERISYAELLLSNLLQAIWSQVLKKFFIEVADFTAATLESDNPSVANVLNDLGPLGKLLKLCDIFLRNNIGDSEELKIKLKNAYKVLGVTNVSEANAFFVAEEGAALYLVICEQIFNDGPTKDALTQLLNFSTEINEETSILWNSNYQSYSTLQKLYDDCKIAYEDVKQFYKVILKTKINYPDFELKYDINLYQAKLPNNLIINSFETGSLYDIHSLEITKNSKNYIKNTEINKVDPLIVNYITSSTGLNVVDLSSENKVSLFNKYINLKIQQFGFTPSIENNLLSFNIKTVDPNYAFYKVQEIAYKSIQNNILSTKNRFLFVRETVAEDYTINDTKGSGQPYTQYLKLVVPQTPEQKACNIRPHYLDVDSIKKQIVDEKSKDICIETLADERTVGPQPLDINELEDLELTKTQKALLNGSYRLATRIFLHDIVLRAIHMFGYYDPQSLRDDKMFISFMSKMAEAEMRAADNLFFNLLSSFLLKQYKSANPEEIIEEEIIKKRILFRDLVESELKDYVLPKLAKRINKDTNELLASLYEKMVKIVNVYDDIPNLGILQAKGNSIYIKYYCNFDGIIFGNLPFMQNKKMEFIYQKIYESKNSRTGIDLLFEFLSSVEGDFLFKYLFPISHTLNYFFMLSVLSTTTRKQAVSSFKDTKRIIINTCKIIQANGQKIASDPSDIQSTNNMDPLKMILGFLIKALLTTPIKIIKGVAEGSEPNIALVSTIYKSAKALKPDLNSALIPAISIPLGTIPTPITSPMPFINPILASTYFGTLAWYDDGDFLKEFLEEQVEKLGEEINCENIINQDNFYSSEQPIELGSYNKNLDNIKIPDDYTQKVNDNDVSLEQAISNVKQKLYNEAVDKAYNQLKSETISIEYQSGEETKKVDYLVDKKLSEKQIRDFINEVFGPPSADIFYVKSVYDKDYENGLKKAREKITYYLANVLRKLEFMPSTLDVTKKLVLRLAESQGLDFENSNPDDIEAYNYGNSLTINIWSFLGYPTTFMAMDQVINFTYEEYVKEQEEAKLTPLSKDLWLESELDGWKESEWYNIYKNPPK